MQVDLRSIVFAALATAMFAGCAKQESTSGSAAQEPTAEEPATTGDSATTSEESTDASASAEMPAPDADQPPAQ